MTIDKYLNLWYPYELEQHVSRTVQSLISSQIVTHDMIAN